MSSPLRALAAELLREAEALEAEALAQLSDDGLQRMVQSDRGK